MGGKRSSRKRSGKDREETKNDTKNLVVPTFKKQIDPVDMISRMPDEIIFRILSLLPMKDVVATRVLSKTWKSLLPGWFFDSGSIKYNLFYGNLSREKIEEEISESLKSFSRKESTFRIFSICVHYDHFNESSIDSWMNLIVKKNFNVLHLRCEGFYWYYLPRSLFSSTGLNVLSLYGCKLKTYGSAKVDFEFRCLRELSLENVCLDEVKLDDFFKLCKNIKKFRLKQCKGGIKHVRIHGLNYLENVEIWDSYSGETGYGISKVSIDSPCLHALTFYGTWGAVCDIDLSFPEQLETLVLDTYNFPKFYYDSHFNNFTKLRKLSLYGCQNMKKIEVFSPSLESLELYHGGKLVQVVIDTPNLQSFKAVVKDFEQFAFLTDMGSCLQKKIRFELDRSRQIDASWFLKLRKKIKNMSQDTILSLRLVDVVSFDLQKLGDISVPSVCYLKQLKLKGLCNAASTSGEILINAILWSCRPKNVTILVPVEPGNFVEDICNCLKCDKNVLKKCYESTDDKCWRHYSDGFEIEVLTGTSKKYPFEEQVKISINFHWVKEKTECVEKIAKGQPRTNKRGTSLMRIGDLLESLTSHIM